MRQSWEFFFPVVWVCVAGVVIGPAPSSSPPPPFSSSSSSVSSFSPSPIVGWFAGSRVVGSWLGNATAAATAGYNTVAGGGIGCTAFYNSSDTLLLLPGGPWYNSTEIQYVNAARQAMRADIDAVLREGDTSRLQTFWASYEALSFPARLVEAYAQEMIDPTQSECIGYKRSAAGCISFARNRTRQVFSMLLDEVFLTYPELDGIVFRYGENSPCHPNVGNSPWNPADPVGSLASFINVVRDQVCVKRNKTVVFRTWDTATNRFNSNKFVVLLFFFFLFCTCSRLRLLPYENFHQEART